MKRRSHSVDGPSREGRAGSLGGNRSAVWEAVAAGLCLRLHQGHSVSNCTFCPDVPIWALPDDKCDCWGELCALNQGKCLGKETKEIELVHYFIPPRSFCDFFPPESGFQGRLRQALNLVAIYILIFCLLLIFFTLVSI